MNSIGWIILIILLVPAIGILAWVVLSESFIRIPSGHIGLLLIRGRPTDRALSPGVNFVPTIRRRMVVVYPSVELTYRAGGDAEPVDQAGIDGWGPPVELFLGDRAHAIVAYTVRYRLLANSLRTVHVRFGPGGIAGIVRDESAATVTSVLGRAEVGVDDLFTEARELLQQAVAEQLAEALREDGLELVAFRIRSVDLGRTGDTIQATTRARHELAAEKANAITRAAQLEHDRALAEQAGTTGAMPWRYRETELWRELVLRREMLNVTLPGVSARPPGADLLPATAPPPESETAPLPEPESGNGAR